MPDNAANKIRHSSVFVHSEPRCTQLNGTGDDGDPGLDEGNDSCDDGVPSVAVWSLLPVA